ncbi:sugar ABC transporter permease [Coleofasciculus sp. FACHB-64]|uniref:ABC transporter permease subunit n=1 Tax=Cyanophyceae TaxID=3028117 RepID=UPI001685A86F|nr:sugar ABC transporter permease [Coleofasciculus sp. FACHB-501]MBD1879644.1 sugar ABC transporter permease [Coleofasciculus sp. FACHB-T130]MBD1892345.1 sugar ABC transporter permease [Coleofasciculus sp. FACHB-SPT9]MBD2046814.1 sugar ABC transporter permease [Coleofasciculus sp. FACHB-64]MBD2084549.1 sugar ABC transporter permease [Coleofasciculus sp. FACHB-542]MBD2539230.1 sugar ABC transporter permease [Coleofasciculus sp. FACHB-SPT36]MBD2744559.1 sugar ABC transporter permease [Coleofasc
MMNLNTIRGREQRTGWILLLPALLVLLLVYGYPIVRAFWLSLFTKNLGTELQPVFVGLDNYGRMAGDGRFWQSFWTTTVFTTSAVIIELLLGLGIALVLTQKFRGRSLVRTTAILPWALPTALIGLAWGWIFNDQFGVVNDILRRVGLIEGGINWLGDPTLALMAVIFADVWKTTPFISILLLAGLQSISPDLYEAHSIDGATPWQNFTRITLPLLMPQILIALLFRFAQSFGIFDLIAVMTGGGPGGSTEVVSLYIYSTVMRYLDFGYGAALVVVTFTLLIVAVAIASFLLSRSRAKTSGAA